MNDTKNRMELLTLGTVIDGFNVQAMGMPLLYARFLELEGSLDRPELDQAVELYQDIMKSKAAGLNINVVYLAAYYILAELGMQKKEHVDNAKIEESSKDPPHILGYT